VCFLGYLLFGCLRNSTSFLILFFSSLIFPLAFSSKLGYEEHIPGQTRDWNEELQTTRELSRKTLPDRLLRERAIFKVNNFLSSLD
jgi:hypothetical protein